MKVAVLGAGAVGCWLAAEFAAAGASVSVAARGATLEALSTRGLRITRGGTTRDLRLRAAPAADLGPQDMVLVATKAQHVGAALGESRALLGPSTTVVSAHNGLPWWFTRQFAGPLEDAVLESVDPGGAIAALLAPGQAVGCVVHASLWRPAPVQVQVGGVDRLIFGEPSGTDSERVRWLAGAAARAGIDGRVSHTIRRDVWTKLWGNMSLNPLSALARASTARLLDDAHVHTLCLRMMDEMAAAGERIGLPFAISAAERMGVSRRLGDFRTSMLQDLQRGAPLEYGPLLGAVVEVARRTGTPAPFCEAVLGLVRLLSQSLAEAAR